jgi:hypothetical protein
MTIIATDVKFKQSERMTDNSDGGGLMTANPVVDNQVGNVFGKITRVDRVGGNVSLMKIYMHVDTANVDVESSSHAIVTKPPADPLVHLVMFDTGSWSDQRAAAANKVENYVVSGPITPMRLWDKQTQGQRSIVCFANTDAELPLVGQVICLSVESTLYPAHQQFNRIEQVDVRQQQFTLFSSNNLVITQNIISLQLSVPLDQDYPGEDPTSTASVSSAATKVRTTQVADAANYYGIAKLVSALAPGDKVVQLDSIFGQIVPSTSSETPLVDQQPSSTPAAVIEAGSALAFNLTNWPRSGATRFLGSPVTPGSLDLLIDGQEYQDAGGNVVAVAGGNWSGSIDYPSGTLTLAHATPSGTTTSVAGSFKPGGITSQSPYSQQTPIDANTRRYNYTFTLRPYPAPGSVSIAYRALGRWYVIQDDGRGALRSVVPNTGSGTINYGSGNIIVTLGALPDVGTTVLVFWGQVETYRKQAGVITVSKAMIELDAPAGKSIEPGSVSITWNDGTARTATDDGAGNITGDASGLVIYPASSATAGGAIRFAPNAMPAPGVVTYTIDYQVSATNTLIDQAGSLSGSTMSGTLGGAVEPHSVYIAIPVTGNVPATGYWLDPSISGPTTLTLHDDGAGHLLRTFDGANVGTITYSSGAWSADTAFTTFSTAMSYSSGGTP